MTAQQVVGLAARLFAIWLAISAIQAFGLAVAMRAQPGAESSPVPFAIAALFVVAACLLWLFPMVVAHKLVPRTYSSDVLRVPAGEVAVIACVVLGLWVLVGRAIPALAYYISVAAIWLKNGQPLSTLDQGQHVSFMVGLVQLAVALFLMLRARRISAYVLGEHSHGDTRPL